MQNFPPEIHSSLGYYVYRLIDPRNGQTFYVGKGRGDRVFSHAEEQLKADVAEDQNEDDLSLKLQTIRDIRLAGMEVLHVVHRHGMTEEVAFEVEAALIEAYPGLTNLAGGHGNAEKGCAHVSELVQRYSLEEVDIEQQFMAISVGKSLDEGKSLYDATRFAWVISDWRQEKRAPVVSHVSGVINGVFEVERWLPATAENFPELTNSSHDAAMQRRAGFIGREAAPEIRKRFINKRLPPTKRGHASPLRYFGPGWN